jgi:hypothetical protein
MRNKSKRQISRFDLPFSILFARPGRGALAPTDPFRPEARAKQAPGDLGDAC